MAYLSDYTAGTVTVSGTTVTGTGTAWQTAGFREGDWFIADGWVAIVASVNSNTSATLVDWAGPDLTDAPYRMRYMSDGSRASAQARQLIDLLGGSGSLEALAALSGEPDTVPMFTGPGQMTLVPRSDLVNGIRFDAQVNTLAERAQYDNEPSGFTVLVANVGDGRSAVYTRVGASGVWSDPAFITGPAITLDVTEVDEVPYGTPPDVTLLPKAGGYDLTFDIPRGMIIEPGTTTTLPPDQPAAVNFVPITGGYRLDISIPRGPTGDIEGVTPFWVSRLSQDANAAEARLGLELSPGLQTPFEALTTTDQTLGFGSYLVDGTTEDSPLPGTGGVLTVDPRFSSQTLQTFTTISAPYRMFTSWRFQGGGRTSWREIFMGTDAADVRSQLGLIDAYTRGNILGTVSQSGGVPTGAIIERGSNANGVFVRYADGTQICWLSRTISQAISNTYTNGIYFGPYEWAFPASFASSPSCPAPQANWGGGGSWSSTAATSTIAANFIFLDATPRDVGPMQIGLTAIGRWF